MPTPDHADKLRLIARGAPFPVAAATLEAAISTGKDVGTFAIEVANFCTARRAALDNRPATLRGIAAGAAFPVPEAVLEDAITERRTAEAFTSEVARLDAAARIAQRIVAA